MDKLYIGLAVALFGALCAFILPKVWRAWTLRSRGPVAADLVIDGFEPFGSPEIYLVPYSEGDPAQAPPRFPYDEFHAWQKSHGGVPLGFQNVRLTLGGRGPEPVVVTKIVPVILSSGPPLEGWFLAPQLGGDQAVRLFIVDLDADPPTAQLVAKDEAGTTIGLTRRYAFSLSDTEIEHIEIEAFTTRSTIEWAIDVHFSSPGRNGVAPIRDGRLRVTAQSQASRGLFDGPEGGLVEVSWGNTFAESGAQVWRSMKAAP